MSAGFIFAIIFATITFLLVGVWRAVPRTVHVNSGRYSTEKVEQDNPARFWTGVSAAITGALTLLLVLIASWTQVGTQNIGIVTSFGRPVGHLSNGLHFIPPWDSNTDMDESVQITDFEGGNCLTVRIAEQQTACLNVKVRWRIQTGAADALFRNYKGSTAGVQDALLTPELQNVANNTFDTYNPVALLNSTAPEGSPANPTVPQLGQQVEKALKTEIGTDVNIVSLFTPNVTYDDSVQARINSVTSQKAETLVAQQSEQTANAQAAANRTLASSLSGNNSASALEQNCLNILNQMVKQGMTPPTGFGCIPGAGGGVLAKG